MQVDGDEEVGKLSPLVDTLCYIEHFSLSMLLM